ncbi:hypothetical protein L484_016112 [Morus notabilis]|uniref:Glycine-rich domain-containing protein 1 n=1 Tax=Morus notabilis TaxID=981085 RepID=W9RQG9_9ROSA|nr:hypothetical protein L484_016112 [Morus notabilis]
MEMQQKLEWIEAQKIGVSVDLVAAAKRQLKFLAAVDRNRNLYEGPVLDRAIYRYNACWLPLLAKHTETPVCEGPLVVPLDCEWIWHCHRLNPVRYKSDCEELYGKILDNSNVVSSLEDTCKKETEEIWKSLYPEEPYTLDFNRALSEDAAEKTCVLEKCTKYDLVSAVKRQSPFSYQVSRPHMSNDCFLKGAVARYKGYLHLIRRNKEKSLNRFCVPTYDIDLIWHTHQLHPVSYCKDLRKLVGKILEHDDTDSNRTKGMKLDNGFSGTTKQWEETFGTRYWRAGAMYRGSTPTPITNTPFSSNMIKKEIAASNEYQKMIELPEAKSVEVVLEFVEVRNLPEEHKGNLFVSFSKTQPDVLFDAPRRLTILSESKEKQVASFECEPTGELLFELVSHSPSTSPLTRASKTLGTTALSLQDLLVPVPNLSVEKWLDLVPSSENVNLKPIRLRVAISCTIPVPRQRVLHMVRAKNRMDVIDETGAKLIHLRLRNSEKAKARESHGLKKEVIGTMKSGETRTLTETVGTGWSLMNSHWSLHPSKNSGGENHICELVGHKMVKFYPGRKLDYEPEGCEKHRNEQHVVTAVEFSAEDPYGKAVALLNLKSGFVKVKEEWMLVPSLISFMIFSDVVKEQYAGFVGNANSLEETKTVGGSGCGSGCGNKVNGGGCGSGCGSKVNSGGGGCGNKVNSAGCGSGCGNKVNSGGGGCGSGCGNKVNSAGCGNKVNTEGSGCGSGCGNKVTTGSSGCGNKVNADGSGCGSGCGNKVSAGGSGCGSGCGNKVSDGGSGCENMVSADGSGCGSGCGNKVSDGGSGCGSGCGSKVTAGGSGCGTKVSDGGSGCGSKVSAGGSGCGSGCGNKVSAGGSGCGSGCGTKVSAGGSGCGSGCGTKVTAGGSGCGSGCGNKVSAGGSGCGSKVSAGGSGCGSGCGNKVSASGSGCGSGCGNKVSASGSGCGSGCGNKVSAGGSGCGSDCGAKFAQSDTPCADGNSMIMTSLDVNEAIAA